VLTGPVTRRLGPLTRAVNWGSGNRALELMRTSSRRKSPTHGVQLAVRHVPAASNDHTPWSAFHCCTDQYLDRLAYSVADNLCVHTTLFHHTNGSKKTN